MTRVVIDTNVVVSANLADETPPAAIFLLAVRRKLIQMCISPAVLAEYEEVLRRPRLNIAEEKVQTSLTLIRNAAHMVHPTTTLNISSHDSDNRFYECAEAAGADYIITGNTRHFLQQFENIRIVTPQQFLEIIAPQLAQEGNQ